jgi:hypothetical protein
MMPERLAPWTAEEGFPEPLPGLGVYAHVPGFAVVK